MGSRIDLSGKKFGRLLVVERSGSKFGQAAWLCQCDCGGHKVVVSRSLRIGESSSCGCFQREFISATKTKHGFVKNGVIPTEYRIWANMKTRCFNRKNPAFKDYGGRGITMHPAWAESFEAFRSAVGSRPSKRHSIDRIDNNRGYEPGNVRWAVWEQQQNNRRNNRMLMYGGQVDTLTNWARLVGIDPMRINSRLQRGWDVERALTTPQHGARP